MPKYRKVPVVVEATQWFKNGDHPLDRVGDTVSDPAGGPDYVRREGAVVRWFMRPEPEYAADKLHDLCSQRWREHGWIDTLEGGHTVCPSDWIITGVQGEVYPCKNSIFRATYSEVGSDMLRDVADVLADIRIALHVAPLARHRTDTEHGWFNLQLITELADALEECETNRAAAFAVAKERGDHLDELLPTQFPAGSNE